MAALRVCVQNLLNDRTLTDRDLVTHLENCLAEDIQELLAAQAAHNDSIPRGDTEEFNPDEQPQSQPDQIIGGKKSRRRRRKSKRSRCKSHKRK
jgi:hypothetical protein